MIDRKVPRAVLRRIDRLAVQAHRFHRFAHHPLCDAYRDELVHLGRRSRICKGCALGTAGGLLGAAVGPFLRSTGAAFGIVALGAACVIIALRERTRPTPVEQGARRSSKWATRFAPAAAIACGWTSTLAQGIRFHQWHGVALATAVASAIAVLARVLYRKTGPNRHPCKGCPSNVPGLICPGWDPIARRERAFRRRSSAMLRAAAGRGSSER